MRRYVVSTANAQPGWHVECDGQALSRHASLGEALTDAMRRAREDVQVRARPAQVLRRGNDGHTVVMLTLTPEDALPQPHARSA